MKTKAWVLVDYNKLELWDVELPTLEPNQALVQIHYTSICGSQINEIKGNRGEDKYLPHLLGHEAVGQIVDISKCQANEEYNIGEIVVCTWITSEKLKPYPPTYPRYQKVNAGPITTFSEYAVIDCGKLVPISTYYHDVCECKPVYALLGCTIPTGAGTVKNYIPTDRQYSVGVLGLGGVGLAAGLCARLNNHYIYGNDLNAMKRNYAASLSISIPPLWKGSGFDYIIECAGAKSAIELAWDSIHNKGSILIAGNLPHGEKISIDPFGFIQGKTIIGIVGGGCTHTQIRDFVRGVDFYTALISKEYSLEELDQAVYDMKTGQIIKPIIKCQT